MRDNQNSAYYQPFHTFPEFYQELFNFFLHQSRKRPKVPPNVKLTTAEKPASANTCQISKRNTNTLNARYRGTQNTIDAKESIKYLRALLLS